MALFLACFSISVSETVRVCDRTVGVWVVTSNSIFFVLFHFVFVFVCVFVFVFMCVCVCMLYYFVRQEEEYPPDPQRYQPQQQP
mmetsp:Transcript_4904/g.4849  ORF Transcript_4904/g.4849 Transcript_4904/m.4849 type:complete len:84 (+) Transcript_4904:113-364(+)